MLLKVIDVGIIMYKGKSVMEIPIFNIDKEDVTDDAISKLVGKSSKEIGVVPIGELNEYNMWIPYNIDRSFDKHECLESGYYWWDNMCVTIKKKIIAIIRYPNDLEDPYDEFGYRHYISYDAVVLRRKS